MLRNRFAAACALSIVIFIILPLAAFRMQGPGQHPRTLSIVALSDLHEVYQSRRLHVPPGDMLIIAGDIELSDEGDAARQEKVHHDKNMQARSQACNWWSTPVDLHLHRFNGWVKFLPHPVKLYTPGNMDTWSVVDLQGMEC
jgi:hypothetical protein